MQNDKLETQKQWNTDPCGAITVKGFDVGTLEYFREARRFRFHEYAPWLKKTVNFESYKDLNVLEIGVGLGSDHYEFAKNKNSMTAIDLSEKHLDLTRQHLNLENLNTDAILGDAEKMPFKSDRFDIVYSFGVLHHTPHTEESIDEVFRVLKPGGKAIIGLYHRDSLFYWFMTIFWNGLLKLGLFRKGYRRLMSEIEYREDKTSAVPLVKVYSRASARNLFKKFAHVELSVAHVEADHFARLSPIVSLLSREKIEKYFGWLGWYVVIVATK